jgi:hypothetical protein
MSWVSKVESKQFWKNLESSLISRIKRRKTWETFLSTFEVARTDKMVSIEIWKSVNKNFCLRKNETVFGCVQKISQKILYKLKTFAWRVRTLRSEMEKRIFLKNWQMKTSCMYSIQTFEKRDNFKIICNVYKNQKVKRFWLDCDIISRDKNSQTA